MERRRDLDREEETTRKPDPLRSANHFAIIAVSVLTLLAAAALLGALVLWERGWLSSKGTAPPPVRGR